jgi:hypothetical protein
VVRHIQRVPDGVSGVREDMDSTNSIKWVWDVVEHGSNGQEFSIIRCGETSSTLVIMKLAVPPDPPSGYHLKVVGGGD